MTGPTQPVPFLDLAGPHDRLRDQLDVAWKTVLSSGRFVGGPEVAAFEAEFAEYCGVAGCVGVGNGTDALELILAGASMVSVGTTIFHDPSACVRILRELDAELGRRGIERLSEVIGLAHEPRGTPARRLSGTVL